MVRMDNFYQHKIDKKDQKEDQKGIKIRQARAKAAKIQVGTGFGKYRYQVVDLPKQMFDFENLAEVQKELDPGAAPNMHSEGTENDEEEEKAKSKSKKGASKKQKMKRSANKDGDKHFVLAKSQKAPTSKEEEFLAIYTNEMN